MASSKSTAAIFEAIGRAKSAIESLASVTATLDREASLGCIQVTPAQREHLARTCTQIASKAVSLCAQLHEIADTQPTTTGETHGDHEIARTADRS